MGDYRQSRNRSERFMNRATARFALRSRRAGSKGRAVPHGSPVDVAFGFVGGILPVVIFVPYWTETLNRAPSAAPKPDKIVVK